MRRRGDPAGSGAEFHLSLVPVDPSGLPPEDCASLGQIPGPHSSACAPLRPLSPLASAAAGHREEAYPPPGRPPPLDKARPRQPAWEGGGERQRKGAHIIFSPLMVSLTRWETLLPPQRSPEPVGDRSRLGGSGAGAESPRGTGRLVRGPPRRSPPREGDAPPGRQPAFATSAGTPEAVCQLNTRRRRGGGCPQRWRRLPGPRDPALGPLLKSEGR